MPGIVPELYGPDFRTYRPAATTYLTITGGRARDIIIAMGSVCGAIMETVDYLNAQGQGRYGGGTPLSALLGRTPAGGHSPSVERICRAGSDLRSLGQPGSPLSAMYAMFLQSKPRYAHRGRPIWSGVQGYPLPVRSSQSMRTWPATSPEMVLPLALRMTSPISLCPCLPDPDSLSQGFCRKIWGLGAMEPSGPIKTSAKIVERPPDLYTQAYFVYDSKKSGA